jgi:hypothetical protein
METYNEMVALAAKVVNQSLCTGCGDIMYAPYEMGYTINIVYGVTETQWMNDVADCLRDNYDIHVAQGYRD